MLRAIINLTMFGGLAMAVYGFYSLLFGDIMPGHATMYIFGGAFVAVFMFVWSFVLTFISNGGNGET